MRRGKLLGAVIKYIPFICILAINITSLYNGTTTILDEIERNIHIWTKALCICAIIGELGSLLVIDRFNMLLTGKTPNFVNDVREESSQDFAVMYNGIVASSFIIAAITGCSALYTKTQNRLFLGVSTAITIFYAAGTAIYILAAYIKSRNINPDIIFSKLSNPFFLPVLICLVQILITGKKTVGFIYHSIYEPASHMYLIVSLIIVLCYFLAVVFCHYSNIYCLLGFVFVNKDPRLIKRKITFLQEQEEQREENLRQATEYVNEKAKKVGIIKRFGLAFYYLFVHLKIYVQNIFYAAIYLLSFVKYKITKRFCGLLDPERIRINEIRFCWSTAVFELLTLDLLLFIYLEGDDPCLKFFELLSTVIIIPVLLSWLTELKSKKE